MGELDNGMIEPWHYAPGKLSLDWDVQYCELEWDCDPVTFLLKGVVGTTPQDECDDWTFWSGSCFEVNVNETKPETEYRGRSGLKSRIFETNRRSASERNEGRGAPSNFRDQVPFYNLHQPMPRTHLTTTNQESREQDQGSQTKEARSRKKDQESKIKEEGSKKQDQECKILKEDGNLYVSSLKSNEHKIWDRGSYF